VRADALRNRERLVDVAQEAFARDGVDTSLEEIARAAGVGIGTLYRRFPSRDDLIAAVLTEKYLYLVEHAGELAAALPPREALAQWLRVLIGHIATYRGLSMAVKEAMHDLSTALGRTCEDMIQAGTALLTRAQDEGLVRPDVAFADVLSLCSGIVWAGERRAEKPDAAGAPPLDRGLLLDIVLRGLAV
jgi:AcrR family transcriptional regulator